MKPISSSEKAPLEVEPGLFGIGLIDGAIGARGVALLRGWLEPGAQHSPHTHDAEEAVLILSGKGVITIDGVDRSVESGDAIWFPPGVVHSTLNTGSERLEFVAAFSDALVDASPAASTAEGTSRARTSHSFVWTQRLRWALRRIVNRLLR